MPIRLFIHAMRKFENLEECLTTKREVAEFCRVTTRTIEAWMKANRLSYLKIGRTVRFRMVDVIAHLERNSRR